MMREMLTNFGMFLLVMACVSGIVKTSEFLIGWSKRHATHRLSDLAHRLGNLLDKTLTGLVIVGAVAFLLHQCAGRTTTSAEGCHFEYDNQGGHVVCD